MKKLSLLLSICTAALLFGCGLMKSVKVPVSKTTLYPYLYTKPVWTIEDSSHKIRVIGDVYIRNDSIFGKLYPLKVIDHPIAQKKYLRSTAPNSGIYLHLTAGTTEISDVMAVPLSSVGVAIIHERAVWLVPAIVTAILIIFLAATS